MGLYIPPTGGSGSSGSGDNNNNGGSSKGDGNSGGGIFPSGTTKKVIFYTRPSVGLKLWGPLVPASDCLTGLYGLTAFQTMMGLLMWRTVRTRWRETSLWSRITKIANSTAGAYVIFNSGLEVSRLSLPYDPWYEEAKLAREQAIAQGKKANWWFGPWDFKPMGFDEWNVRIDRWILEQEGNIDRQSITLVGSPEIGKSLEKLREINTNRQSQILQQLHDGSFKDILPNYQTGGANVQHPNRPDLILPPGNELEDDIDLDEVWSVNDPWELLGQDTDILLRLIP